MNKIEMIEKVNFLQHNINILYPKYPNDLVNWDFIKEMAAERDTYLKQLTATDFRIYRENHN